MKTLLYVLSEPVAVALGWTLLHALWQGFALVMPAAFGMHLLRRKSSALRYNIGVGALLAQVLTSAITFGWYYQPSLQTVRSSAKMMLTTTMSSPVIWPVISRSLPWHVQAQRFLEGHLTEIVLCWLVGVILFLVRLAGGWLYVQRLKTSAVQPADVFWQASLTRLRSQLAIRQPVRVMESMQVLVPMVVGALKPVILLPVGLTTGLSMREAEAILAHELAHVKRFDYAINLLQSVVEVAFFFHPALWWLSTRVREERENCCDDLAVLACGDARSLAQALARLEEFSRTPMLAMALASQKKLLLNRVRRMLGVSARPVVSNAHLGMLTLITLVLATVSVYAMQEKEPQPKPRKTQPVATRRHKTPNGTEFGITDNRKVDYIIWKGQKLPAKRVVSLQRQLDKVMGGQLSLDDVTQPDRDILLNIIETGQVSGAMANPIIPDAAQAYQLAEEALARVNMDSVMGSVAAIDYKVVMQDAFSSLSSPGVVVDSVIQPDVVDVVRRQDSLLAIRELNAGKEAVLKAQAQAQRFAVEAVERKIDRLERQKSLLEQKRFSETSSQQQAIQKSGFARTDSSRVALTKQIDAGEVAIQKTETAIETLNQQIVGMQAELEKAAKPLRATEAELRKLRSTAYYSYSTGWGSKGRTVGTTSVRGFAAPGLPTLPEEPKVPTGMTIKGSRKIDGIYPRPAVAPVPNVRPAKPAVPAKAPKPALAPTSNDNASLAKPYFQVSPTWFLKSLSKC